MAKLSAFCCLMGVWTMTKKLCKFSSISRTLKSSFQHLSAVTNASFNNNKWNKFINRNIRFISNINNKLTVASTSYSSEYGVQEGPSFIFAGPVETTNKDMLEALYQQVPFCPPSLNFNLVCFSDMTRSSFFPKYFGINGFYYTISGWHSIVYMELLYSH